MVTAGDESLSHELRKATSCELVTNTWAYVVHPHLINAAAAMDTDIPTLFQSFGDGDVDCTNLVDIVRQAGEECALNGTWSSILQVMALSSVD